MAVATRKLLARGFVLTVLWIIVWICYAHFSPLIANSTQQQVDDILTSFDNHNLSLDDICITVKTSKQFHDSRLSLILKTWDKSANGKVYYVTDQEDIKFRLDVGKRLVVSQCGSSHRNIDLCCKLDVEYTTFMQQTEKRWWCLFDDDNYVNVDRLVEFLRQFDSNKSVYIGRRSVPGFKAKYWGVQRPYQFGTGGAGVCISRPLAQRMRPWFGEWALPLFCFFVAVADDCAIGFIITYLLGVNLTESFHLHSHYEHLNHISTSSLREQVSLSYSRHNKNVVSLPDARFNVTSDPTRMLSLHCYLQPQDEICLTT